MNGDLPPHGNIKIYRLCYTTAISKSMSSFRLCSSIFVFLNINLEFISYFGVRFT